MPTLRVLLCFVLSIPAVARATVVVEINPPFSNPPFSVTAGYSVSYSPTDAINLTIQNPNVPFVNTNQYDDNKWGASGSGVGNTSWGPVLGADYAGENAPELAITVSGFTAGNYNIFGRVFTNSAPIAPTDYGVRLGLASGNLTSYFSSSGGTVLATGDAPYEIREFYLGSMADDSGELTVYLDDFDGSSLATVFFGGLRIEGVPGPESVPEPSTLFVVVIAAVSLAVNRRRRAGSRRLSNS